VSHNTTVYPIVTTVYTKRDTPQQKSPALQEHAEHVEQLLQGSRGTQLCMENLISQSTRSSRTHGAATLSEHIEHSMWSSCSHAAHGTADLPEYIVQLEHQISRSTQSRVCGAAALPEQMEQLLFRSTRSRAARAASDLSEHMEQLLTWSIWSSCSPGASSASCAPGEWTFLLCCDSLCVNCCVVSISLLCCGTLFVYATMNDVKPQHTSISKCALLNFLSFVIHRCKVAKLAPNQEMSAPGNASCIMRTAIRQSRQSLLSLGMYSWRILEN